MKVGDLVKWRVTSLHLNESISSDDIGIILEIRYNEQNPPDYRTEDAALVLWANGYEWSWISELVKNESR